MSSYIDISNSSFQALLKNDKYNELASKSSKKTKSVNLENSINLKEKRNKILTTQEILSLYNSISKI